MSKLRHLLELLRYLGSETTVLHSRLFLLGDGGCIFFLSVAKKREFGNYLSCCWGWRSLPCHFGYCFYPFTFPVSWDLPQALRILGICELARAASVTFADLRFCDVVVIWSSANARFIRVPLIFLDVTNCDFIAHNPEVAGSNPASAILRIDLPLH